MTRPSFQCFALGSLPTALANRRQIIVGQGLINLQSPSQGIRIARLGSENSFQPCVEECLVEGASYPVFDARQAQIGLDKRSFSHPGGPEARLSVTYLESAMG